MRFRRQKTLFEVVKFLMALGKNVTGSSGLKIVSAELANHLGVAWPQGRDNQWQLLANFVGKPASFKTSVKKKRARKAGTVSAKKTRGAKSDFLESDAWMRLRYQVLKERGARCECCGATRADGIVIQVDHIRPRSLFPELALDKSNLQVLCRPCNLGKSNRDDTDWRGDATLQ